MTLIGAPIGRAQVAEDEPERSVPGEPASEQYLQVQGDADGAERGVDVDVFAGGGGTASELVHVPVANLYPGAVPVRPSVHNPVADGPAAASAACRTSTR
jgi:hypothetical protein